MRGRGAHDHLSHSRVASLVGPGSENPGAGECVDVGVDVGGWSSLGGSQGVGSCGECANVKQMSSKEIRVGNFLPTVGFGLQIWIGAGYPRGGPGRG